MDLDLVLAKTDKAINEIKTRQFRLNSRIRAILIVVDGKLTVGTLLEQFKHIDTIEDDINNLITFGFLRVALNFKKQRKELSRALTDVMGPHADIFTIEIEGCNNIADLKLLLVDKRDMLQRGLGKRGEKFWTISKDITD